jgi:hypothetical protein
VIFRRLFKNAQMQVELCEIPLAGGSKSRETRDRWAFFNGLLKEKKEALIGYS